MKLVGLDIETTGLDVEKNGLLTIGFAWFNEDTGKLDSIHQNVFPGMVEWDYEAYKVNAIEPLEVLNNYHDRFMADFRLRNFLDEELGSNTELRPVGWNVGSFDMQFVKKFLPNTYKRFSHRSVELNSIATFLRDTAGFDKETHKQECESFLKKFHDTLPHWHNAEYDAKASIISYELMKQYATD